MRKAPGRHLLSLCDLHHRRRVRSGAYQRDRRPDRLLTLERINPCLGPKLSFSRSPSSPLSPASVRPGRQWPGVAMAVVITAAVGATTVVVGVMATAGAMALAMVGMPQPTTMADAIRSASASMMAASVSRRSATEEPAMGG